MNTSSFSILDDILRERQAQVKKWGIQHHPPEMWMAILMEEVGEASQAYLHTLEEKPGADIANYRTELIQAAAVIVAAVQDMDLGS